MTDRKKATILPYLGAIAIVLAAVLLRAAMAPILQDRQPFAAFIVAVIVAARFCGFTPSLLSLFLSSLASSYFFVSPQGSLFIAGLDQQASFVFFVVFSLFISLLMQREKRIRQKLEQEITNRKMVETELRVSQDRFYSFVENGPFLAFIKDEDGRYVYVNKLCQTNWKRESSDWLGRTDYDLFPKDSADLYLENDRLASQNGSFVHFDETATTPESVLQYWSTTKFPMQSVDGRRLLGGVSINITETRKAMQHANESEARLLLALEAGRLGTFAWNISTNRVQFSETQAVIHGRRPDQTDTSLEESISNICPGDLPQMRRDLERVLKNEAPESMSYRVVWPDGSIHWIEAIGRVFCDASGKPNQVMGVCQDTTERQAAEQRLKLRESQLSGILDNATAIIYLKDSEGRYLLSNRRHQNICNKGENNIVGKKDSDIFPESFARNFIESDAQVWQAQCPLDFEELAPHPDGLHTYRSVKFPVRDESGKMIALGGISTDITDLKEALDALKSEQELLRNLINVQEKRKQFICQEFHDGLIQYAVGSLMLLEGLQNKYPPTEFSSTIDSVISNLRNGVEDGRRVIRGIRPAVLDDSGLEAAIDDLVEQFSTPEIIVTSDCDPEIGRLSNSIQTTVYRVVQEAMNNAVKHSGTDVVRIELKKITGDLLLEIRDFGCGFNLESVPRKGFGLLGMRERVRLLGGECLIHSEKDAGTRISVRLPLPVADDEEN